MKKYLIFAASALALASCSSDDFLGENPGNVQNATTAINFGGEAGKITRATKNEGSTAEMLDGQFKVYGVKKVNNKMQKVFVNYSVWDVADKNTTSNTNGWEYVGKKGTTGLGTGSIELNGSEDQTIKYWDYSASEYHFVAGSPISSFTYEAPLDLTNGFEIKSATVTGFAGHINANKTDGTGTALVTNPIYIADPVKIVKDDFKDLVNFTFKRQQSMVRVGIYETIPGYTITGIKFYAYDTDGNLKVSDGNFHEGNNIILTSSTADYFVGGSNIEGTISYDWAAENPSYIFAYTNNLTKSKNWYAGELSGVHATTSAETNVSYLYGTDKDMSKTGYFTVLPTQVATASPILIKCDYELTADDNSGEVIHVTGATAAIPAAFSKWEANTRYTYLFKISQATNGTTGKPADNDPVGLFPITFAASVTETLDATEGTTTTVATPSITTHQAGSVTDKGIEYKTGTAIDVTVTNDKGEVQPLNTDGTTVGSVAVYKFTDAITEAEIQVKGITGATAVTGATIDSDVLKFTPDTEGYYAIQYLTKAAIADPVTPAAYTYKVVYVKEAPTVTPAP